MVMTLLEEIGQTTVSEETGQCAKKQDNVPRNKENVPRMNMTEKN